MSILASIFLWSILHMLGQDDFYNIREENETFELHSEELDVNIFPLKNEINEYSVIHSTPPWDNSNIQCLNNPSYYNVKHFLTTWLDYLIVEKFVGEMFRGENFHHLAKISSLFPDETFTWNVFPSLFRG